jgi:hypothetical protein
MSVDRHTRTLALGVVALGIAAAAQTWLVDRRPQLADLRPRTEFVVTSADDSGPGTLREAIFAADSADARARIVIRVPEVRLRTPLPPLVNPRGIELATSEARATLNAERLKEGVVLDIQASGSRVENIAVRGASEIAIRIAAAGVSLAAMWIEQSAVGLEILPGSQGLILSDSDFVANETGVQLQPETQDVTISGCRFRDHTRAAFWATRADDPPAGSGNNLLVDSTFDGDAIAIALANSSVRAERNEISRALEVGIFVAERRATLRNNRIREGAGVGIFAASAVGIEIADNEIDHNGSAGVVINSGGAVGLRGNRIHANAFGLIVVFGEPTSPHNITGNMLFGQLHDGVVIIGGSPAFIGNRIVGSGGNGLDILDYLARNGGRRAAQPLLEGTILSGNRADVPVRGVYHQERADR